MMHSSKISFKKFGRSLLRTNTNAAQLEQIKQKRKLDLESLLKSRFFYTPSNEIYGGFFIADLLPSLICFRSKRIV